MLNDDYFRGQEWLFDLIISSYYQARRHKRSTLNQLNFELDLERNLARLFEDIRDRRYQLNPSIAFIVTNPKRREVFAAHFRDRIVHHIVYNLMIDYWERHFIYDSYSCRLRKGTHFGIQRVAQFLRQATGNYHHEAWVMKLDVDSYFTSINQGIMWELLGRIFTDPRHKLPPEYLDLLAYLLPIIVFARPTYDVSLRSRRQLWQALPDHKSLFWVAPDRGFPIGNLTSQLFSNIYLGELDIFVKNTLKVRYYGRYVDDMVLVDRDRNFLLWARDQIETFLNQRLLLRLAKRKLYLQPARFGVTFIGGQIRPERVYPGRPLQSHWQEDVYITRDLDHGVEWRNNCESYLGQLRIFRYL